jgi:hypothetical protein
MSTGAECRFYEKTPGAWFYKLQDYPYGANESYTHYGPFGTFKIAHTHLNNHHANPGGFSIDHSFPCKHDLISLHPDCPWNAKECDRCGESWPSEEYEAKQNYEGAYWQAVQRPIPATLDNLLHYADAYRKFVRDAQALDQIVDAHTIKLLKAGRFRLDSGGKHSNAFAATLT